MDPVDGPANQSGYAIGEIDDPVEIRRQRKIIELEIAETEMQPELHPSGTVSAARTIRSRMPFQIWSK